MNLHNADLGCVLVRVLIERKQPWLVRFDELHQTGNALPFRIQLSRLQSVACDEDERASHQSFLTSSELLAGVRRRSLHLRGQSPLFPSRRPPPGSPPPAPPPLASSTRLDRSDDPEAAAPP